MVHVCLKVSIALGADVFKVWKEACHVVRDRVDRQGSGSKPDVNEVTIDMARFVREILGQKVLPLLECLFALFAQWVKELMDLHEVELISLLEMPAWHLRLDEDSGGHGRRHQQ